MVRNIFKSGNSLVISLPREFLNLLGWREGSEVNVVVDQDGGQIIIQSDNPQLAAINPTFVKQLNEFIEQYRPALEALAV